MTTQDLARWSLIGVLSVGGACYIVGEARGRDIERAKRRDPTSYPTGSCQRQVAACRAAGGDAVMARRELKNEEGLIFDEEQYLACQRTSEVSW